MTAAEGGDVTRPAVPETNPGLKASRPPVPGAVPGAVRNVVRRGRGLPSGFASLRDLLSFAAGVSIIAHEVWWSQTVEVAILTVGVALAGLPVVFGADEKKSGGGGGDPAK